MCGYNKIWAVDDLDEDGTNNDRKLLARRAKAESPWTGPYWECESATTLQYLKEKYPSFWVGTDWSAVSHDQIDKSKLLARGLDEELPGHNNGQGDALTDAILQKDIDEEGGRLINDAVMRILRSLNAVGLLRRKNWSENWDGAGRNGVLKNITSQNAYQDFQENRVTGKNGLATPFTPAMMEEGAHAARKAARQSTVLLRNAEDLLPLRPLGSSRPNVPNVWPGDERIGLFGCQPSPIENGDIKSQTPEWWSGFFINGGGSGAVSWGSDDLGKQVRGLDDAQTGIPIMLSENGGVVVLKNDSCTIPLF